ncbi:hypothetical protein GGS20DRAFT_588893 [Poronia punctata]|nr:hypothetical protein GGS20DRAFT_588893 [Poronia punctata]
MDELTGLRAFSDPRPQIPAGRRTRANMKPYGCDTGPRQMSILSAGILFALTMQATTVPGCMMAYCIYSSSAPEEQMPASWD